MTLRGVRVTVLCEDTAHERFVRTHLKEHGVDISRHYRALPLCGGDGAGDRYVRDQYADAVRALRSRAHDANVALVVMTDVDTTSADRRRRQLSDALQEEHEAPRGTSERIVLLLPRRNVETWVVHLNGERVDEERDYKPQPQAADVGAAARALREHCRDGGSPCCPDSLLDGCRELQRLDGPSSA